ncbi:hypothetical protein Tsubulata_038456 [Turnera subulata]|uniref:Uncharacterized protein n=1 Tax=Turnera subulata TaxID=218843 RepID=A0A9Q0JJH6_9ROSI|nr:hypothetical protein Tsubulata_038456 [Turnera subulata]
MASSSITTGANCGYYYYKTPRINCLGLSRSRILVCQGKHSKPTNQSSRRELILRSSELAVVGAIFNLSGKRPEYLGVQKNQQALALCPATNNCISTAENISDLTHYAPPWNYNANRKQPVSREVAMKELFEVVKIFY